MKFRWYGLNRTYCDTLEDMRSIVKNDHINRGVLNSLIAELQVHGNRMESGLSDLKDLKELREKVKELKEEGRVLRDNNRKISKNEK